MGLVRFYIECISRAFSGKFFFIEKWTGGLGLLALLVQKFAPVPDGVGGMLTDDLPLYFFLLAFFGTVFAGFVTAPYSIYKEQREKAFLLEMARKPKLEIYIANPEGEEFVASSSSNETGGGVRFTYFHDVERPALCLVVRNSGETRSGLCTAKIVSAECVEGEMKGPIQIIEPITLPWTSGESAISLDAKLDPKESRRIIVAKVRSLGHVWLWREVDNLSPLYQQVFGPEGKYRATIQITDGIAAPVTTEVEITGMAGGQVKGGVREGSGRISILKQTVQPLPLKGSAA